MGNYLGFGTNGTFAQILSELPLLARPGLHASTTQGLLTDRKRTSGREGLTPEVSQLPTFSNIRTMSA